MGAKKKYWGVRLTPGGKPVRRIATPRRRKRLKEFAATLWVAYKRGFDPSLDKRIEKAVGTKRLGSGFCFVDGERDMNFGFYTVREAKSALMRVKRELKNRVSARVVAE